MNVDQKLMDLLNFLRRQQDASGVWAVEISSTADFAETHTLTDVFTTAFIVREVAACVREMNFTDGAAALQIREMLRKACHFLGSQRQPDGLWKFYKRGDLRLLPNDFDTTSCTAAALHLAGENPDVPTILRKIEHFQHPEGGYWTYAMPPVIPPGTKNWFYPITENLYPEHVINAHILFFLAVTHSNYAPQRRYIMQLLESGAYRDKQMFYDSPLLFLYNVARAIDYMNPADDILRQRVKKEARAYFEKPEKPTLNTLDAAYLLGTLAVCGDKSEEGYLHALLEQLLKSSLDTWKAEQCYLHCNPIHFYGSAHIMAAIISQSLYQTLKRKKD